MDAQTGGHCHWYLMLSDFTTFKLFHLFLTYFQRYETWEDPCLDWRELPNCHWHRRPRQEDLEFYILIQHSTLLSPLRSCPKSKVQYHSCWNRIIFETQAKLLSHCLKYFYHLLYICIVYVCYHKIRITSNTPKMKQFELNPETLCSWILASVRSNHISRLTSSSFVVTAVAVW